MSAALGPVSPIANHVRTHGDGVHDLAIRVSSASDAALAGGANGVRPPSVLDDESGKVSVATIALYGDTQHTFVERAAYSGVFLPGFSAARELLPPTPFGSRGPPDSLLRDHPARGGTRVRGG